MRNQGKITLGMVLVLFLLLAGLRLGFILMESQKSAPPQPKTQAATLLPELRPLPPFSLIDQRGERYDNQRLQGHWTLLDFGYTHCPDICPTTLATLAQVKQQLQQQGLEAPLEIGFVSVDPLRDTPKRLAEYLPYFDPGFFGLTGSPGAIDTLARPLGILYRKVVTEGSAMDYVMDHSVSIVLLDPQGRYYALFSPPHDAAIMAGDILSIIQGTGSEAR